MDHKRTYCGYTNDIRKRLFQHNGLKPGGAKATRGKGPWEYIAVVYCGSWTRGNAMSMEWHVKHDKSTMDEFKKAINSPCSKKLSSLVNYLCSNNQEPQEAHVYIHTKYADIVYPYLPRTASVIKDIETDTGYI